MMTVICESVELASVIAELGTETGVCGDQDLGGLLATCLASYSPFNQHNDARIFKVYQNLVCQLHHCKHFHFFMSSGADWRFNAEEGFEMHGAFSLVIH